MQIRKIRFGSKEYEQMVSFRVAQLLQPIGVPASYINSEQEQEDIFVGAFQGDMLIGCCILTPKDKNTLQLRQMAVKTEQRGKGIGATIIEFAEGVARENHFSVLMMHARNPVIDFYRKCGYEISGGAFFEVGIGHHKMMKQLF